MAARDAGAANIVPLTPYDITVSYTGSRTGGGSWFGPLQPLAPVAPANVAGRIFDFPSGYNLNTRPRPYEKIGFPELRALADNFDLLRLVIETRKDQVEAHRWTIRPIDDEYGVGRQKPTQALLDRCKEIKAFFKKPDGSRGWKPWLRELLEQLFVYDAPAIYRRPTRGGKLYGLDVIDGATIVPKIDDTGHIVAFQQILKGLPAVDYSPQQLIYRPRNVRADRVYGFSPVEQIMMTVNIALRRQVWQLQYFTEGNVPDSLIGVPETWTPDQIAQFQMWWDSLMEGNTGQRRHAKFVPAGIGKTFIETKNPELFNKQDEWLARVVCFAFSISPQPFVQMMNRATAGTAQEQSTQEGLIPTLDWVKDLVDERIAEDFKEPDAEFVWLEDEAVDAKTQAEITTTYVKSGILRPNEGRARIGEEPDPSPAADKLGVVTATGFIPLDLSAEPPEDTSDAGDLGDGAAGGGSADQLRGRKRNGAARGSDGEVGKSARTPFFAKRRGRKIAALMPTRKEARDAATSLRGTLIPLLAKAAKPILKQVRARLDASGLAKADDSDEERQRKITELAALISEQIDLAGLDVLVDATADELEQFIKGTAGRVLAQLGVADRADLVDQVNERAVEIATDRAAELVGKRWVDGALVDNPDATFRIDEGTRDLVRRTIANGLDENVGLDEIVANIEDLGFGEERADLIARTEIARANSDAALESYRAAESVGVNLGKEWLLGENPCPICEDNEADGVIGIDDGFSSGDDAPPAHPNCECAVSPVVLDGEDATADEAA